MKTNEQRTVTPVAQSSTPFLSNGFLQKAKRELQKNGFISDEHDFAPYREALTESSKQLERALRRMGFRGHLAPGFIKNHPAAGYAYFVYDTGRFRGRREAEAAVSRWLDQKYRDEAHA